EAVARLTYQIEASIDGAHGVLLSIQGGSNLGIFEINDAARLVQEAVHPEANIIFGAVIDDALGDEVRVTVIAAGFDGGAPKRREQVAPRREERAVAATVPAPTERERPAEVTRERAPARHVPERTAAPQRTEPRRTLVFEDTDDDLDVPDFLK
ncbi:MAG: cell division protein FtsZ, partial [Actinomycetota bacterium]